jgi:hypothetical protein
MKLRNLEPSKEVGIIIDKTINWIVDNEINIENTEKIQDYIKSL